MTVPEEGKTRARDRFVVTAPRSGYLRRVDHELGDAIAKGEVIARISPPDPALLDPRSRDEAQARLVAALAQERATATSVVRATAADEDAARNVERMRKLAKAGAAPQTELERAELGERVTAADLAAAREQRAGAAAQVVAARAVLGRWPPAVTCDHGEEFPPAEGGQGDL